MKIKFNFNKRLILIIPFILLALILIIIPMIIVVINAFKPIPGLSIEDNWSIVTASIWKIIFTSFYIAFIATFFCVVLAYPFCYFLSTSKSKLFKAIVFLISTSPIWLSFLLKLIGIKSLFDLMNGSMNSTYGNIFTIIGSIYLYIPFMIIPLYNSLEQLPRNLISASKDLGRGNIYTFFYIIVPYTKMALFSGIALVFLPLLSTVAINGFLNNANDSFTIGAVINNQGQLAYNSQIALSRTATLSLVLSMIILVIYMLIYLIPKVYRRIKININRRKDVSK